MNTPYPWRLMGAVAAIVFVITIGAGLIIGRPSSLPTVPSVVASSNVSDSSLPGPDQRQATILLQVRGADRRVAASVLLGFGGTTQRVAAVIIPTTLVLPTFPAKQLADVDGPSGPVGAREPLSALLGVRIDETIELDRLAWAGVIDALGPADLRGMSANDVVGHLGPVLSRLPASRQAVGQLLTSLGSMARTTLPNETTGRLVVALGDRVRQQGLRVDTLPVTVVKAGAPTASLIDPFRSAFLLGSEFPQAQLAPGHAGATRVVVARGATTLGTFMTLQQQLDQAGFAVVAADTPPRALSATVIEVAGGSPEALARGRSVATALGVPPSAVVVDMSSLASVDVRVTLGNDITHVWG